MKPSHSAVASRGDASTIDRQTEREAAFSSSKDKLVEEKLMGVITHG